MENKPKLVIFSAFYEPFMSGAEQMVKEIAERLGRKYDIVVITGKYDKKLGKKEQRDNFKIVRVGIGHKQIDKILYVFLAPWLARRYKPQIIHAIMESYAGAGLVLARYIYPQAKRILTLQSGDLDDIKNQKRLLFKVFFKIIHTSPDVIMAISNFLAKRAKRLGVDEDKIFITPNGVDMSEVSDAVEKTRSRVVMVGRLSWEKGHNYLIKAWPEVLRNIPDAKLVLVGEGDKRSEIENILRDLNIEDSVRLTGNLPHKQVLVEIKKSEIFVCPSLAEGLGNVFIEAQACGVPPIGTNVGGIPDIIVNGENGLLIKSENAKAISEAIIKLLSDKNMVARFSKKGLETVQKFSWPVIMEKVDMIYQDLLK